MDRLKVTLVDRVSNDHYWSLKMLPDSTKECINLASYNYLGFAENNGDCTDQGKCLLTLEFLIHVLSWISILGEIFHKSNKHPPLNKDPGRRISTIFSFLTLYFAWSFTIFLIFSYFLRFLSEICEKTIAVLSLIRTSWHKNVEK